MKRLILLLSVFTGEGAAAQSALPSTDIFIADLQVQGGVIRAGKPVNITRRKGYDNQPSFADNTVILYTSAMEDGQTDIFRYHVAEKQTLRLTRTAESEYSPTLMPDGKQVSVICVEKDSTQRLWSFPLPDGQPALLIKGVDSAGYHCWINSHTLAFFILTRPFTLQVYDTASGELKIVDDSIGRCFQKVPGEEALSYVYKKTSAEWYVRKYDPATGAITTLVRMPEGSEDFAWTPQGVLLAAAGTKLMKFDPVKDKEWQVVADFSGKHFKAVYRLAVNPAGDKIAMAGLME